MEISIHHDFFFSTGRKVELWNIHESDSFLISH